MNAILEYLGITPNQLISVVINIVLIIVTLIVLTRVIKYSFKRIEKRMLSKDANADTKIIRTVSKVLTVIVYIVCIFGVTNYFPALNSFMATFLTGSGVAALIISIASQDAISNFVGGIMISFTKPFAVGDYIRYVDINVVGQVEKITMRHTVIKTFENKRLIIPNSIINKSVVENSSTAVDKRICVFIELAVTYESDIEKAMQIVKEVVEDYEGFVGAPKVETDGYDLNTKGMSMLINKSPEITDGERKANVKVVDFADSAIIIKTWLWVADFDSTVKAKNDVLLEIKRRFDTEGIDFAYPHVVVKQK